MDSLSRQVPGFPIYGVGQPTEQAFPLVLEKVLSSLYPGTDVFKIKTYVTCCNAFCTVYVQNISANALSNK
jgi:hypothetical protein